MNMRDLIPWGRHAGSDPVSYGGEQANPFLALHREMNRMFDDVFREFGAPSAGRMTAWPTIEIAEADSQVRVSAELPGLDENDVDVSLSDGVLTIRGEKKSEVEDKERRFSERFYGRFERRIPVGPEIREDEVSASFHNGLLTVILPKSAKAQAAKRIPISGGGKR